jgi:hypothetical protein
MAQIIGSAVLNTLAAIKARHGEQGLGKIFAHLDGEAKRIFTSPIEPWKWYPLDAFVDFLDADINETAAGDRSVLIERAKKVVDFQLREIDNIEVTIDSPKFVINRVAVIHATQFKGVQIIPEIEDGSMATIKYIGFAKHHDIFEWILIGFYLKALEMCGAKDISANFTVPISAGGAYSEITITWT